MSARSPAASRQNLIRLIHVAKRDLAMDDESYRAMLGAFTGQASSAKLSVPQLEHVLAHMKKCGFTIRQKSSPNRLSRPIAQDAQSKKIRALWLDMHHRGIVRDASESALGTYVKRITGIDALQWLNAEQSSHVIETLKKWRDRAFDNLLTGRPRGKS